jgi:hypothetical protein
MERIMKLVNPAVRMLAAVVGALARAGASGLIFRYRSSWPATRWEQIDDFQA